MKHPRQEKMPFIALGAKVERRTLAADTAAQAAEAISNFETVNHDYVIELDSTLFVLGYLPAPYSGPTKLASVQEDTPKQPIKTVSQPEKGWRAEFDRHAKISLAAVLGENNHREVTLNHADATDHAARHRGITRGLVLADAVAEMLSAAYQRGLSACMMRRGES